ncbi:DMT family transporter [Hoeflea sp. YIM 152468]|uniref:DMT family transporter n=1 Tax=Hoeflea sp. YIM 152468 TaxID=3031759 RepID=UPI0023D9B96F|nr:DMT family transporter [Hoeflea sp. YIM 152468]MDF1609836.1 DMT family transporter [Hoeflea sp. YIM 152468]
MTQSPETLTVDRGSSAYDPSQASQASQASLATRGGLLVFGAAMTWSFGGAIARGLNVSDPWTIIAWRSFFAALFLLAFMLWRDGPAGTVRLFRTMGLPGVGVGLCFATASISFVVALGYTSVANILLMQAGVPLIAALLGVVFLGEAVDRVTWAAILAVIAGIGVMVSDSFAATVSFIGDGLALMIAVFFAAATVITRRYSGVRMTPAVCFGVMVGTAVGVTLSSGLIVSASDLGLLFVFGALNLGLGMAMFATGARLIPSALAALISTMEPVFGPVWVWLIHAEVPAPRTLVGGGVVFLALIGHILWQWRLSRRTALPLPN